MTQYNKASLLRMTSLLNTFLLLGQNKWPKQLKDKRFILAPVWGYNPSWLNSQGSRSLSYIHSEEAEKKCRCSTQFLHMHLKMKMYYHANAWHRGYRMSSVTIYAILWARAQKFTQDGWPLSSVYHLVSAPQPWSHRHILSCPTLMWVLVIWTQAPHCVVSTFPAVTDFQILSALYTANLKHHKVCILTKMPSFNWFQ